MNENCGETPSKKMAYIVRTTCFMCFAAAHAEFVLAQFSLRAAVCLSLLPTISRKQMLNVNWCTFCRWPLVYMHKPLSLVRSLELYGLCKLSVCSPHPNWKWILSEFLVLAQARKNNEFSRAHANLCAFFLRMCADGWVVCVVCWAAL